ncbi:MAG: hypothetical protein NC123_13960 [Butyrivibrio sp.]|nr:hypothetical protein [Acetatifactor muris]MCM1560627.1 hypothetical protein [Butyrivibrio sp.]
MGRYIKDIQLEQPIDVVSMVMDDFIYHNRFSRTDWNGEMVFYLKDRHNKERYMKWAYVDGQFHVEAWLKNAMGGETDLDGVGGGASRKEFRASIDGLIETLKKTAAGSLAGGHIGSDPLHHDSGSDNHDTWKQDTRWQQGASGQQGAAGQQGVTGTSGRTVPQAAQTKSTAQQQYQTPPSGQWNPGQFQGNASGPVQTEGSRRGTLADPEANSALVYAILGLVFGWAVPVLGIIFVVMSFKKQEYSSNPKRDKTLCIVAIVEMVVCFVGNFVIGIIGALAWGL